MFGKTYCVLLVISLFYIGIHGDILNLRSSTDDSIQKQTVREMIQRVIPTMADNFVIEIDSSLLDNGNDVVSIQKAVSDKVKITASNGVAAAWGFHHYLKYYCFCQVSWQTRQLQLPEVLPPVDIKLTAYDRFRYYQNVCTSSYSFVWWDWSQWENHIDWMALNGINMPLAFNGQETIWTRVYKKYYNLTANDYAEHFTGPAFLAWNRMANIRGWMGPLTEEYLESQLQLQKLILERMRGFGMLPVLPSFAGLVPRVFKTLYPNADIVAASGWGNFPDQYANPYMVVPTDPLFRQIGEQYLNEMIAEFGTDHLYSCDPYNEIEPNDGSEEYLHGSAANIYNTMHNIDSQAVWVLQNWFFVYSGSFWSDNRIEAFLNGVPKEGLVVLDLFAENSPRYESTHNYYGHYYIWCMLHNFGGNLGMYGSFPILNQNVYSARAMTDSTMIGTGLAPEGINQNYMIYEYMLETSWRNGSTVEEEWAVDYAHRRYGCDQFGEVWKRLMRTIYHFEGNNNGLYTINRIPNLGLDPGWWYDPQEFLETWSMFLNAGEGCSLVNNSAYNYDVVDITRQALQVLADLTYIEVRNAHDKRNLNDFRIAKEKFLRTMSDMDEILAADEGFLLGRWLEAAKTMGRTQNAYEHQFEYNARRQITLWGLGNDDGYYRLVDYANKQWSGIVGDYFRARWKWFLDDAESALIAGEDFNGDESRDRIRKGIEEPFQYDTKAYPTKAHGDAVWIAKRILNYWRP